jgi:hypothetical protein
MRKNSTFLFISLAITVISFAQPASNPVAKGNKMFGLQMMLAPTDVFWSQTALSIREEYKSYGLHLAANYGWFVETGWFVGGQLNAGFYNYENKSQNAWRLSESNFDIGITPNTRYYFQVDRKHRFKPFLLAAIPIVYSSYEHNYGQSSGMQRQKGTSVELSGSFGFGAAYFGQKGNIELNISNMGFFLGVNKHLWNRKNK